MSERPLTGNMKAYYERRQVAGYTQREPGSLGAERAVECTGCPPDDGLALRSVERNLIETEYVWVA